MMRKRSARWLERAVLVPLGVLAVACGGSVDLDGPSKAAAGSGASLGGAGSSAQAGGAVATAGANLGVGAGGKSGTASGGSTAGAGSSESAGGAVTTGMGRLAWLAYDAEPDGEKRGVYLMTAVEGGSCSKRLTSDAFQAKQPAFSDDGKLVAYASDESGVYQIHLLDLSSGETKQLTDLPGGASYPTISPNGQMIAFVSGDPEALRDGLVDDAPGAGDLMVVFPKTLETQLVKARAAEYPYFSPAFSGNDRLFVANSYQLLALYLENGAQIASERVLSHDPAVPQDPAPSPDGQNLAYLDSCSDALRLYVLRIDLGSSRSCTAPTRALSREMGYLSADWGAFGFIVVENNHPSRGLFMFREDDLSGDGALATMKLARNPDWAPTTFTPACD